MIVTIVALLCIICVAVLYFHSENERQRNLVRLAELMVQAASLTQGTGDEEPLKKAMKTCEEALR